VSVLVHVLDVLLVHVRVRMGVIVVGVFMLVLDVLVVVLDVCVGVFHVPVRVLVGVRQIGHRIAPIVVNTWHCIHIVSHPPPHPYCFAPPPRWMADTRNDTR